LPLVEKAVPPSWLMHLMSPPAGLLRIWWSPVKTVAPSARAAMPRPI